MGEASDHGVGKQQELRSETRGVQMTLWVLTGKELAGQPPPRPRATGLISEDEELECVPQPEEQGPRSRQVGQGQEISFPFISRFLNYIPISWGGTDPEIGLRWDQSSYTGNCMGPQTCVIDTQSE